jgi:hypothetical protein
LSGEAAERFARALAATDPDKGDIARQPELLAKRDALLGLVGARA